MLPPRAPSITNTISPTRGGRGPFTRNRSEAQTHPSPSSSSRLALSTTSRSPKSSLASSWAFIATLPSRQDTAGRLLVGLALRGLGKPGKQRVGDVRLSLLRRDVCHTVGTGFQGPSGEWSIDHRIGGSIDHSSRGAVTSQALLALFP